MPVLSTAEVLSSERAMAQRAKANAPAQHAIEKARANSHTNPLRDITHPLLADDAALHDGEIFSEPLEDDFSRG